MTREEINFIEHTLDCAIEWSDYADDYFKAKHNLEGDKINILKAKELINQSRTCSSCKYWNKYDRCEAGVIPTTLTINGITQKISDTFGCSKWEKK